MSKELTPAMRRSVLIAALRDEEMWPDGFVWEYNNCDRCASGMYQKLYAPGIHSYYSVGDDLGLNETQARHVFNGRWLPVCRSAVTPAMVADRLESIHRELSQKDTENG
jgi:hypothetical protein